MPLIILDRDGVINFDSDAYIKSPAEWHAIPESLAAIARLNQAGYTVAIATNQSGVGRGYYPLSTLDAIHKKMLDELVAVGGHIDMIAFCPHTPEDNCDCRKPKPGLLYQIADAFQADLTQTLVIGDAMRDLQAAHAANARAALVLTGKGEKNLTQHQEALTNVPVYKNLAAAVDAILRGEI
jgi:D-glycero-D-manno-heptose 1,7-bisphosphate phosphatase